MLARAGTRYMRWSPRKVKLARSIDRIASTPWYWCGAGGMDSHASSVSSATTPSMSAATYAPANRLASACSVASSGRGALPRPASSRWLFSVARARCRVPLIAVWLVLSMLATSWLSNPSTSRSTSVAAWRGGMRCRAAIKASSTASVVW